MGHKVSDEMARLEMLRQILRGGESNRNPRVLLSTEDFDDAALIRTNGECWAIASDFVRGSGFYLFQLGLLTYFDIGYYLIVANVSDIAAMGAKPFAALSVIRYSKRMGDEDFLEVVRGMKAAADVYDIEIVGGDTGGYSEDVFAATAIGTVNPERALLRRNARIGDVVCVTGTIGLPITALTYFKALKPTGFTLDSAAEERLLESWKRPVAHVREGQLLSEHGLANAAQDISDGLKATIEQMSSVTHKGFTIHADRLPIHDITKRVAGFAGVDPVQIAVSASVDFELLFTVPEAKLAKCSEILIENGLQCIPIGEVNSEGTNVLVGPKGERSEIPGLAWKQQEGDYLNTIIRSKPNL